MTHNAHFLAHTLFFYRFAGKNFKQLTPTTTPIIWRADDIWNCLSENSSTRLYSISYNWLSISIKSNVSFPLRIVRYVHKDWERERERGGEREWGRERVAEVLSWLSKQECFTAISSSFGIVVLIFSGSQPSRLQPSFFSPRERCPILRHYNGPYNSCYHPYGSYELKNGIQSVKAARQQV